jgi:hypothetical protein
MLALESVYFQLVVCRTGVQPSSAPSLHRLKAQSSNCEADPELETQLRGVEPAKPTWKRSL